jgi:hypothetical protein
MTLEAEEFIRRFLLHVLPEGFQRIRYYGFLANRYRGEKLADCRELLGMPSCEPLASEAAKDYRERYEALTGCSLWECPVCHQGRMVVIEILPRSPPENGNYGYVVMNKMVVASRSKCAGQAWPGQATVAVPPHVSSRTFSKGLLLSADAVIAHRKSSDLFRQSRTLTASDPSDPHTTSQPAINTHRPPAGQRFCPIDF